MKNNVCFFLYLPAYSSKNPGTDPKFFETFPSFNWVFVYLFKIGVISESIFSFGHTLKKTSNDITFEFTLKRWGKVFGLLFWVWDKMEIPSEISQRLPTFTSTIWLTILESLIFYLSSFCLSLILNSVV